MSDKQCPLRNLPKVSSQMVQARIEPGPSTWRAGLKPIIYHRIAILKTPHQSDVKEFQSGGEYLRSSLKVGLQNMLQLLTAPISRCLQL